MWILLFFVINNSSDISPIKENYFKTENECKIKKEDMIKKSKEEQIHAYCFYQEKGNNN